MTPLDHVLNLLKGRGAKTKHLNGTQWEAQCPAHEDRTASLSLNEGTDSRLLLHCHAGCTLEAVVGALGITTGDLFPPKQRNLNDEIIVIYDYHDTNGTILYQVVKKAGKQFRQRRPDGNGGWIWNLDSVQRVPYRLPQLVTAVNDGQAVFIVEGEKDADRLRTLGLHATTIPGGAGKWRPEYVQWFTNANRIYIIPDNDQPGKEHAQQVARELSGHVDTLKVVELSDLPPKGDISDWFDSQHTIDELRDIIRNTAPWQPGFTTPLGTLLDEIFDWYGRFVAYPTIHDQIAHTLWTAHTHAMDAWNSTPRLAFLSPEPASGKTRALEVTEPLVPNPVNAVNVTPAYLFRKVGEDGPLPTILYDEIDTVFGPKAKDNEEIRGLINAGHRRGAVAGRCVVIGKIVKTEEIPAYCAVALAGIGEIPDTILTRSIVIRMRRRAPGETVEPYRARIQTPLGEALRDRLTRTISQHFVALEQAWPTMPPGIEDRDADKWEPLLAIADAAGGTWPQRARLAVTTLVELSKDSTPSLGIRLLEDIRTIFAEHEALTTEMILKALTEIEEAPWGDLYGKPLNARGLAQRLHKYEIPKSRAVRVGTINARGHARADFDDAWKRYLAPAVTDVTDVTHPREGNPEESTSFAGGHSTSQPPISHVSYPQGGNVTSVTNVTFNVCDSCNHPIPGSHFHWCPDIDVTSVTSVTLDFDPADLPNPFDEEGDL